MAILRSCDTAGGFFVIQSNMSYITEPRIEQTERTGEPLVVLTSKRRSCFRRAAKLDYLRARLWRRMSLDESLSDWEKLKFNVWEYPVEEKYTKIFNEMKRTGFLTNKQEAANNVRRINRTREFAYIGETIQIRYLELTNCDFQRVGKEFGMRPFAIAVKKGSTALKSKLDDAITQVALRGIPSKLEKKWWDENPARAQCSIDAEIHSGFTLGDMRAIFLLIPLGILLASITLCLQYWPVYRSKEARRGKTTSACKNESGENIAENNGLPSVNNIGAENSRVHGRSSVFDLASVSRDARKYSSNISATFPRVRLH